MLKEVCICMVILILIFLGNGITQGYSKNSIEDINEKLVNLREEMNRKEIDEEAIAKNEESIDKQWEEMFSRLAYYIEHEELEKFSRNLENAKTYIQLKEYDNAIKEINEGMYILNHIEDKYSFNLQNIF